MRARLHEHWPLLARFYRLYPDDVCRFSLAEWNQYIDQLAEAAEGT